MRQALCCLLILTILSAALPLSPAFASAIDGEAVIKGLGVALVLITIMQFGQQLRASSRGDQRVSFTAQEMDLFQRIIMAEASGEPYEGKVAVGAVIINRIKSPYFPDTLREVIYAQGQFEPVANGALYNEPNRDSVRASHDALKGEDPSRGALYFYNRQLVQERGDLRILSWFDAFTKVTIVIGNHTFAR